jgi:hypothetical protein
MGRRSENLWISTVVNHRGFYWCGGTLDHLIANLLTDADHPARRAIDELRDAFAPLPSVPPDLIGRERIQPMNRYHEGYSQFTAEQGGGVSTRQRRMGMNDIDRLGGVRAANFRKQASE